MATVAEPLIASVSAFAKGELRAYSRLIVKIGHFCSVERSSPSRVRETIVTPREFSTFDEEVFKRFRSPQARTSLMPCWLNLMFVMKVAIGSLREKG